MIAKEVLKKSHTPQEDLTESDRKVLVSILADEWQDHFHSSLSMEDICKALKSRLIDEDVFRDHA